MRRPGARRRAAEPLFALRDETLLRLARRGGIGQGLFSEGSNADIDEPERRRVEHARRVIADLRRAKASLPTAALLERALDATGYDATLMAEFLGERKRANLDKLVEQARQNDAGGGDLRAFLKRLTEFTKRPPKEALAATSPEEADVVRLMTVHRAKGLEFPIVVLPDLNRPARPEFADAAFHSDLGPLVRPPSIEKDAAVGLDLYLATERRQAEAEQDRLFYVACTRAADRLILSSCLSDPGDADSLKGPWLKTLAKRFDLANGGPAGGSSTSATLVEVTPVEPQRKAGSRQRGTRANLAEVVAEAERLPAQPPAAAAEAVLIRPDDLTTFSVSRLTGRLHREQPSTMERAHDDHRDALALGTLVHAVLEHVDTRTSLDEQLADSAELRRRLAPLHSVRNAQAVSAEAGPLIERFLRSERWRRAAAASRLQREVEFLLAWPPDAPSQGDRPSAMIRGYIDAICWDDASSPPLVLDYKTNRVAAAGVPQAAESYRLQLAVYALAVEAATGERPESLALQFLHPGVEHRFAWGDAERARAIDEIDAAIAAARAAELETTIAIG